jgi:hypothetical protein
MDINVSVSAYTLPDKLGHVSKQSTKTTILTNIGGPLVVVGFTAIFSATTASLDQGKLIRLKRRDGWQASGGGE